MPDPIAKTAVSTIGTGTPMACAITRSCIVARIQMPKVPNLLAYRAVAVLRSIPASSRPDSVASECNGDVRLGV
jgi:hypothetical protein